VVLDAMGVIYQPADDVRGLLIPYLRAHACPLGDDEIRALYMECTLGRFSSTELWRRAGVKGACSDEDYCRSHRLNRGVIDVAREIAARGVGIACLSNDVSEWSGILRRRFGLEDVVSEWVISGDVGVRKPSPQIYRILLGRLGCAATDVVFVDDSEANLDAAAPLPLRLISGRAPTHPANWVTEAARHQCRFWP
jgi:HAD superfamily hydrolase (TIGR01509 family)